MTILMFQFQKAGFGYFLNDSNKKQHINDFILLIFQNSIIQ